MTRYCDHLPPLVIPDGDQVAVAVAVDPKYETLVVTTPEELSGVVTLKTGQATVMVGNLPVMLGAGQSVRLHPWCGQMVSCESTAAEAAKRVISLVGVRHGN